MSRLFVFATTSSGHGAFAKRKSAILDALRSKYDIVDLFISVDILGGEKALKEAAKSYDAILIVGGDGTFHHAINTLAPLDTIPPLGYLPNGTLNDVGKGLGISRRINKALKQFLEGEEHPIDIGRVNDVYFVYMAAVGAFSDIPYSVKSKTKRIFKRFAYYPLAAIRAFQKKRIAFEIKLGEENSRGTAPFLMALNHRYVGGFNVNKQAKIDDGKLEFFVSRNSIFNGLWTYAFSPRKVQKYSVQKLQLSLAKPLPWCLDGEPYLFEKAEIEAVSKKIHLIYSSNF